MRIGTALCIVSLSAGAASADAQKHDLDGGTMGRGRPASCLVDTPPRERCTFYPRNGDGSFAIQTSIGRYYANRAGPDAIQVDFDNGARMVDQGVFTRSRDDRACWVRRPDRRICAW
ncbi:hypothetical protein [Sphingomonas sp.]|uniref:hypothetical protein n=1 Tax=Sphingomonas sp. TaxID=28214 RepID=UPI003CC63CD8